MVEVTPPTGSRFSVDELTAQKLNHGSQGFRASPRFVVTFGLTATALLGFYYFPYAQSSAIHKLLTQYLHNYAAVSGAVLRLLEPKIVVSGQDIIGRYSIRIVKTCDGMDVNILLFAAIMAWPSALRRRLVAAAIGIVVLFSVNTLRICTLYLIGVYAPASFEFVHLELWPVLILVVAVLFFLSFIRDVRIRASVRT